MATMLTHAVLGAVAAKTAAGGKATGAFVLASAACAAVPDIDTLGMRAGIPYEHMLGHRGLFHSPFFALLVSVFVVFVFFRKSRVFEGRRSLLVLYFFVITAGHGVIDALTNGGLGVAFLSPFSNERYYFGWRPLQAAPFGRGIFSPLGQQAMADELAWLLFPAALVWLVSWVCRNVFVEED